MLSEPQYEAILELPCFVQEGSYPPPTPTPLGCQGSPLVQHFFVFPLAQIKLTLNVGGYYDIVYLYSYLIHLQGLWKLN